MSTGALARDVLVLDRDGTIVEDRGYLADPAGLVFLPGAAAALRQLHERGYRLVVVTNQSGIERGLFSLARLNEIHAALAAMVRAAGSRLEGIYFCPHAPQAQCQCRKPQVGLVKQAAAELGFDLASVIVVGDKASDMELGKRIAAPTILVGANAAAAHAAAAADHVANDLMQVAQIVERLR